MTSYILKAGVAGVQTPQTIWNFPQKDENAKTIILNAQKLTILQYVSNNGKDVLTSLAENPISLINMLLVSEVLKFFKTAKQDPQTYLLLECMRASSGKFLRVKSHYLESLMFLCLC